MVDLAPFRALRYDPAVAGDPAATSAPAYDDLEPVAFASHRTASPYTVLELLVGGGDDAAYASAGATYRRWRRTGVLRLDPVPALYRYEEHELHAGVPRVQRGVLGALALEPFGADGGVLPHEAVEPDRVAARAARLDAVPVDVAPVFALARLPRSVRDLLAAPPAAPPLAALSDGDGVDHRVWALTDPDVVAAIAAAVADVRVLLADGHHRYAAALARRDRRGAAAGDPSSRTLVYLADVEGPRLCPVHRILHGLPDDVVDRLARVAELTPAGDDVRRLADRVAADPRPGVLGVRLADRRAWVVALRDVDGLAAGLPGDRPETWRRVDAALLAAVAPDLGASAIEPRGDLAAAVAEVDGVPGSAVAVLRPVDVGTVLDLAAAGERLPAKTTSFRPKPRSGLVLRPLDDVAAPTLGR